MDEIKKGMPVKNILGRDDGKIFVVLKTDKKFVYIVDGKARTLQKPKRKNPKHIKKLDLPKIEFDENTKDLARENAKIRKELRIIEQTEEIDV